MARAQWVAWVAKINPFTYAVEGLRLSLYGYYSATSLFIVNMVTVLCFILAVRAYSIRGLK
jgi:ABC-type polysaccharide/polyol phosphate export permease